MIVLRRVVFTLLTIGVVGAMSAMGQADPTITFKDCVTPSPTPTSTAPVSQPTVTPGKSASPTPAPTPAPTRTPGPDNCTPKSKTVVWDTQALAFNVASDGFQPLKNVKLQIKAYKDSQAVDAATPNFNAGYNCNNQPDSRTSILVPWDTKTDTPHNGHYEIVVDATTYANPTCGGSGHSQEATRTDLLVDNAPDQLDAPRIVAVTPSTVTIQWDASTAPDVTRYEVFRAATSSAKSKPSAKDFQLWGYSSSTSFRDPHVNPGTYWYAVIVTRRSVVTPDDGISSVMSDPSAPATITAPVVSHSGGSNPVSTVRRYIPLNPIILPPSQGAAAAPVPDAPYSAQLPYGNTPEEGGAGAVTSNGSKNSEEGSSDPRGPVLPVAVGAFLVSAALALGRMPY